MSKVTKDTVRYKSANGTDEIVGYYYTCEEIKPKAVLQISHGMCEYIGRYDAFADYMAQHGYAVCGNDHLGHGETSRGEGGVDGYFADKDGRKYVLQDLHRMNCLASKRFPGLPILLLGHSMGSFFARLYAGTYPETIQGLILSGTGGPNPLGGIGMVLTSLIGKIRGTQHRSKLVHNMAFGAYLKKIDKPSTVYDWISRDKEIVDTYSKDPKCTYTFTVSAFHELMATLKAVNAPAWAQKLHKDLPVYLFSGAMDPVGDYGKGVQSVCAQMQDAGLTDVSLRLYEGGRHEMLNETNRTDVYADVLAWCDSHIKQKA
ncbi:MAG: alpha/beta hydrolase [Ruthenibacterium sp.]